MKKSPILALLLSASLVLAQSVSSGPMRYSGPSTLGYYPPGGAPLTYSAGTDNCVTGAESGCIGGATTGHAGSPMSFMGNSSDPVPFSEQAPAGTAATDPDFNAYEVMATDQTTSNTGSPYVAMWNMGSDGGHDAFSTDSRLLLVNNSGGGQALLWVRPDLIHTKACVVTPSPNCVGPTGIYTSGTPDSTHLSSGGASFSRVPSETNKVYELSLDNTYVNTVTVCRLVSDPGCSGQTTFPILLRSTYVDFKSNTPVTCNVLEGPMGNGTTYNAAWSGSFQVGNDGSVSYALGGGIDWAAGWTPTVTQTFINPTVGNTGNKGFQATAVTGPTGSVEPGWVACDTAGSCTDGGVTWTAIGTTGGQGPGFDEVSYRPGQGCTRINTRLGIAYQSTGNPAPSGPLMTDDIITCTAYANGGSVPSTCPFSDRFSEHEVEQEQDGVHIIFGPTGGEALVGAGKWNDGTAVCQPSSDAWQGQYSAVHTYAKNDVVSYGGIFYESQAAANAGNTPPTGLDSSSAWWVQQAALCNAYMYNILTGVIRACDDYNGCTGHGISGHGHKWFGKYYNSVSYDLPTINGVANPGTHLITQSLPCDDHGTGRNENATDTAPPFTSTTNVPSWPTRYTASLYDEIAAFKTDGSGTAFRFGHNYNDASEPNFSDDNAIGVISYLGDLFAYSTDMMCTRGNITAASTSGKTGGYIRGMLLAASGMSLLTSDPAMGGAADTVYPVTQNNGDYIYVATVSGTTTGASPTGGWCQTGPSTPGGTDGCTQAWGSATIQNIGASNCRADVVILDTLSSHRN